MLASAFGFIFAADHANVAGELARVARPGGAARLHGLEAEPEARRALPPLHRGAARGPRGDRVGPRGPRRGHARRGLRARVRRRHALDRRRLGRGAVGALLDLGAAGARAPAQARRRARRGVPPARSSSSTRPTARATASGRPAATCSRSAPAVARLRSRSCSSCTNRTARSRRSRSTSRARLLGPRRARRRPLPRLRALGALRREATPRAAGAVRAAAPRLPHPAGRGRSASRPSGFAVGEWERSWDDDGYAAAIEAVRAAIARGDVYQANLVQHLSAPFAGDPARVAAALAPPPPARAAAVRRRRLGDRLGLARALPRPPRRPARDDADQGHAPRRRGRRGREGRAPST